MAASKAQTEIVGLLIIVILLIFLSLIYLKFTAITPPDTLPTTRTHLETHNTLSALMKTSPQGETRSFEELFVTCHTTPLTCQALEAHLNTLFPIILPPGRAYALTAQADTTPFLTLGSCSRGITATHSFIRNARYYEITLTTCTPQKTSKE